MDENLDFVKVAKIKVIGVGGGGNNAVNRMVTDGVKGVDFYVANTDAQVLKREFTGVNKIFLGRDITQGLGAGGNPEIGRKAAQESENEIREALADANMVLLLPEWWWNRYWWCTSCCKDCKRFRCINCRCSHFSFHI